MPQIINKSKSFWSKPEGVTGGLFLLFLVVLFMGLLSYINVLEWIETPLGLASSMTVSVMAFSVLLNKKFRQLTWFSYKRMMRWITSFFVNVDPISVLKGYIVHLEENLKQMNRQVANLRGQMHLLKERIVVNQKAIVSNLETAGKAKLTNDRTQLILNSRKAGRLKQSNIKLEDLYTKMEVLYRVLTRMHENSLILVTDVRDQVEIKETERKAIHASHSAIASAMSIIRGDRDKRAVFDQALETIADDVSVKMGEMEKFMSISSNFLQSIDIKNGILEEDGLRMLEKWEKESSNLLLDGEKGFILDLANDEDEVLDLNSERAIPEKSKGGNQYDSLFEE